MKKILVIGKNGYIANCFKNYMKQFPDYEVNLITACNDAWKLVDFKGYDAVYNTAGLTHNDARAGKEEEFYALNADLPYDLALKARKSQVSVFVNMSSSIVYGNMAVIGRKMIINPLTKPEPDSIYGKSKLEGEKRLESLKTEKFRVAIIRSPLVYGITAPDNVEKLIKYALKMPIFPKLENEVSMIYDEDLCELVRLIVENNAGGIYFPQMDTYISTSQFVKDIAEAANHSICLTSIFNPILRLFSYKMLFIQKAFGNQVYDKKMSDIITWEYRIVNYQDSIKRIVKAKNKKN